jgi:hypothetical protein
MPVDSIFTNEPTCKFIFRILEPTRKGWVFMDSGSGLGRSSNVLEFSRSRLAWSEKLCFVERNSFSEVTDVRTSSGITDLNFM